MAQAQQLAWIKEHRPEVTGGKWVRTREPSMPSQFPLLNVHSAPIQRVRGMHPPLTTTPARSGNGRPTADDRRAR
ncbi:hypothetical protein ACFRLW_40180 [Streptomyces sp. NPDC056728]